MVLCVPREDGPGTEKLNASSYGQIGTLIKTYYVVLHVNYFELLILTVYLLVYYKLCVNSVEYDNVTAGSTLTRRARTMTAVANFLDEVVLTGSSAEGPVHAWDVRTGMQLKSYK